ncbi:metal ABC transporter substrate-binding protein [Bordetella avium]|nr:metal ABC transporter substrate-binding protein [Bordetella avium]AZY47823.1 metal ABC transporter substrate-binding protein [Bordetella avium]AZY51194.1 metal ABC transporter substrate-binding protein [Bordetella avium]RIQ14950.1 metal ABC transporter substrate-binding protein [Bordetella avium]RIQ18558.1 metal ABC transporter substrate-binding protein [Bordetella avium]RIQ35405.1 metal ABC transporter substrate-binding protein [Bordetella avium]
MKLVWARCAAIAVLSILPAVAVWASPVKVVTSFSILQDMAREIGGPDVEVQTLVGPDGDAHGFEPSAADSRKLAGADLLVINGLGFEPWLPRLVEASGFKGREVRASDGVKPRAFAEALDHEDHDHGHDHHHDVQDPHAWQDLRNGMIYAQNIGRALEQLDPAHAAQYQQRTRAYVAKLEALQAKVEKTFAAIPAERRKVVSTHDAFAYFGEAYGVRFIPVAGLSTLSEPSASGFAEVVKRVKREHVPALFIENIGNPRLAEQIARETGAKVGGTLYSDALSAPGKPGATYLGMFEWNVQQLAAALQP